MSEQHFSTFRKFNNRSEADALQRMLEDFGFDTILEDTQPGVDITFTGNVQSEVRVKLRQKDFEAATEMLQAAAAGDVNLPDDHYLHEFTNEELLQILVHYDEWSDMDQVAAVHLLRQRGAPVDPEKVQALRHERLEDLRTPVVAAKEWIFFGYVIGVLGLAFPIGGICAMGLGWGYWRSKKTLPNGELVPSYDEDSRKTGKTLFNLGWMMTIAGIGGLWVMLASWW